MIERRERIPADEVTDSKRWNLPYWTEPEHLVQGDEAPDDDDADSEHVIIEEAEIEVEPLTAEQLELIRQEAFNEGLEQGLIEGRQKGEKLGYDDGHKEGLESGQAQGRKIGFDSGFEQGENQAKKEGQVENEKNIRFFKTILSALHQDLIKQKKEMADSVPDIILTLAKAVVGQELNQGSEHIVTLVEQALAALPLDSAQLNIQVNPADLPFVEAAIKQGTFEGTALASDKIETGGCRIETRYSAADFTLSERWHGIEKQYFRQWQLSNNDIKDDASPNDDLDIMALHDELAEQEKQNPSTHKNETIEEPIVDAQQSENIEKSKDELRINTDAPSENAEPSPDVTSASDAVAQTSTANTSDNIDEHTADNTAGHVQAESVSDNENAENIQADDTQADDSHKVNEPPTTEQTNDTQAVSEEAASETIATEEIATEEIQNQIHTEEIQNPIDTSSAELDNKKIENEKTENQTDINETPHSTDNATDHQDNLAAHGSDTDTPSVDDNHGHDSSIDEQNNKEQDEP